MKKVALVLIALLLASLMLTACGDDEEKEDYANPPTCENFHLSVSVSAFGREYLSDELVSRITYRSWPGKYHDWYLALGGIEGYVQFYVPFETQIESLNTALQAYFPRIEGMPKIGMSFLSPDTWFFKSVRAECGSYPETMGHQAYLFPMFYDETEQFDLGVRTTQDTIYTELRSKAGSMLSYRVDRQKFDQLVVEGLPELGQPAQADAQVDQPALSQKILNDVLGMSENGGMEVMNFTFVAQDQYGRDQLSAWIKGVATTLAALYPDHQMVVMGWDSVGTTYASAVDIESETFFRSGGYRFVRTSSGYSNFEYHSEQRMSTDLFVGGALYLVPIS